MTKTELINMLQEDLKNELKHQFFYLFAAVHVQGLHREELREFFKEEAQEELGHVLEFADLISYLGGEPELYFRGLSSFGTVYETPYDILEEVVRMEREVAANYAKRLKATEPPAEGDYDPEIAAVHVFYEDQIKHSQTTAWEVSKWLKKFPVKMIAE